MSTDIVSPGELYTAYKANFPMENAYFHGNNKTDADIKLAIDLGIGHFIADNREELDSINRIAAEKGIIQKVILRITPGIDPHTHAKINTGKVDSKFGTPMKLVRRKSCSVCTASEKHSADRLPLPYWLSDI